MNKPGKLDLENRRVLLGSGYYMPANGIGAYSLHDQVCIDSLKTAIHDGIRLIDTAHMYHNEKETGQAVRESGVKRSEIFITTKLYPSQYDQPDQAIDDALRLLKTDYIDLLLLHHPGKNDLHAWKALERAVKEGKVRSIGLSNWNIQELKEFLPHTEIQPALVQNEIHPYYQETDVVPFIQELGIAVEAWYPLGGRGHQKELLSDPVLQKIASAHDKSIAQVILRWCLQRGIAVIPGSSDPVHIRENTEIYDFELSDQEMEEIAKLNRDEKHDWY